jgi:hypothetical protein
MVAAGLLPLLVGYVTTSRGVVAASVLDDILVTTGLPLGGGRPPPRRSLGGGWIRSYGGLWRQRLWHLVWLFVQQRSSSSHGGWQRGRHGVGGVIVGDDVRGVEKLSESSWGWIRWWWPCMCVVEGLGVGG